MRWGTKFMMGIMVPCLTLLNACMPIQSESVAAGTNTDVYTCGESSVKTITRNQLMKSLLNQGVQLAQIGEETELWIPNKLIFKAMSANWICPNRAKHLMRQIAALIRSYDLIDLDIKSEVISTSTTRFVRSIADHRAETLGNLLWDFGLDARIVNMRGIVLMQSKPKGDRRGYTIIHWRYLNQSKI